MVCPGGWARRADSGTTPASVKGGSGRGEQRAARDLRQLACAFHAAQFVIGLEVEPELRAVAEVLGKAERGVRGDGALAMHDFIDAARRDADVFRKPVFGKAERLEKFFDQHFAGRDEREQFGFPIHIRLGSVCPRHDG